MNPSSPSESALYQAGIQLFNAGHYWHAHEQWEQCWLHANEPDSTFYKAIIQAAAALVKWQQGNLRGFALNWAKSRKRIASLPPIYHGLNLALLAQQMEALAQGTRVEAPQLTTEAGTETNNP